MKTTKRIASYFVITLLILVSGIAIAYIGLILSRALVAGEGGSLNDNDSGKLLFLYALPVTIGLLVLGLKLVKKKTISKYAAILLFIGSGLNGLILLGGTALLIGSTPNLIGSTSTCTQLDDQIFPTINATVPLATNIGTGTGFAIKTDGQILTAYHVVDGASEVYINYANGKIKAEVIKTAPEYDLALLKAETSFVYPLKLTSHFELGDDVLVTGYPGNAYFAGRATISKGIISRLLSTSDLRMSDESTPDGLDYIQTDAPINSGNSGGALVNRCGVVGLIVSKSDVNGLQEFGTTSEDGISYAVSAKTISERFGLELNK